MRYDPPWLDKSYLVGVAFATIIVGLMLERALRRKDEGHVIRFEGVTKSYLVRGARHVVLDDVSFCLPPRSRVGILGANGAGKTSLLRLAAGAEMPDRGQRCARRPGVLSRRIHGHLP